MGLDKARIFSIACNSTKEELKDMVMKYASRIDNAIAMVVNFGGVDGAHHKDWTLDQTVRILAGKEYERIISEACDGEDGPDTYTWDVGIAP